MSDKPTPFVSDEQLNEIAVEKEWFVLDTAEGVRDLYETHLAEVKRERWVKVEDRLPDELQWVILRHNQPNTDAFDTGYIFTIDGRKTWKLRWEKHGLPLRYFTHWMPLPEPPNTPPSHG